MNVSLSDIKWANRAHYGSFTMQVVNGIVVITATDVRDGCRYVVGSVLPSMFIW